MKQKSIIFGFVLAALLSLSNPVLTRAQDITLPDPVFTSQIGSWYTTWWTTPVGATLQDWSPQSIRFKPLVGDYTTGEPTVFAKHCAQMKDAGISFLLLDETNGIDLHFNASLDALFKDVATLAQNHQPYLPLCIAMGSELSGAHSIPLANATANSLYAHYASGNPYYYRLNGKPLLVTFNGYDNAAGPPGLTGAFWGDPSDSSYPGNPFTVRRATGIVSIYNPLLHQYPSHGWWGWVMEDPDWVNHEEMTVSPGWNKVRLGDARPPVPRNGGQHFINQWLEAINVNPTTIMIAGWNDFGEETSIEPATSTDPAAMWTDYYGKQQPDWYLQIASAYGHLRTQLLAGTYYKDQDSARVYVVKAGKLIPDPRLPHHKPIIVVPSGTLSGVLHPRNGWNAVKDSRGKLWSITDGQKHAIRSAALMANLGYRNVTTLPPATLASIPTGVPAPNIAGPLLSSPASGAIYWVNRGIKFVVAHTDLSVFFPGASPVETPEALLSEIPTGPHLLWPLAAAGTGTVYLCGNGTRSLVSSWAPLKANGWAPADLRLVPSATLANYQDMRSVWPGITSTLFQRKNGRKYLLQFGAKRFLSVPASRYGITGTPQDVSDATVDSLKIAPSIGL